MIRRYLAVTVSRHVCVFCAIRVFLLRSFQCATPVRFGIGLTYIDISLCWRLPLDIPKILAESIKLVS